MVWERVRPDLLSRLSKQVSAKNRAEAHLEKGGHLQQVGATVGQGKEVEAGLIQAGQGLSIVVQSLLQQAAC